MFFCVIFISNNYISTSYNGCKLVFHLVWTLSSWYINSEYGTGRRYPFFPLLFWIILWDLSPRPKVGAFPSMRTWFQMHVKSTTYNLSLIPHPPHPPKKKKILWLSWYPSIFPPCFFSCKTCYINSTVLLVSSLLFGLKQGTSIM